MAKNKKASKGDANKRSLADRMKTYETVTTGIALIERLPIYARIDMRAGHTWCRGLTKPFDSRYTDAMQAAVKHIIAHTGAAAGYCQSDEASFVWLDHTKIPFETRLFKLQSVLASMFTGAFVKACLESSLKDKTLKLLPSFDCRVMNLPNLEECANMILWRVQDSVKNSITLLALEHFSTKQLDKKSGLVKIQMLKELGIDYYTTLTASQRFGAFFHKENYSKKLDEADLREIPEKNWPKADENGDRTVIRSRIVEIQLPVPLDQIKNRDKFLFLGEAADYDKP